MMLKPFQLIPMTYLSKNHMEPTDEQISFKLVEAGEEYKKASEELTKILPVKVERWLLIRAEVKSDRMADMMWDKEEPRESALRIKLKALEKVMSAYKTRLHLLNREYWNQ